MVGDFSSVIHGRRSVRVFEDSQVAAEVINRCLELSLLSPSSSNLQPWEFYWVRSTTLRRDLITACLDQPAAKTAAELIVIVARTDTWRRNRRLMLERFSTSKQPVPKSAIDYYERLVPIAMTQGFLGVFGLLKAIGVFFMGLVRPVPREPTSKCDLKIWAIKSVALAAQTFMLAIRAEGFDSCPMEGFDSVRVKKLLGLGRGSHVVMVVGVGKRTSSGVYGDRIRFDRELFVKEV